MSENNIETYFIRVEIGKIVDVLEEFGAPNITSTYLVSNSIEETEKDLEVGYKIAKEKLKLLKTIKIPMDIDYQIL